MLLPLIIQLLDMGGDGDSGGTGDSTDELRPVVQEADSFSSRPEYGDGLYPTIDVLR